VGVSFQALNRNITWFGGPSQRLSQTGVLATLRLLFAKIRVGECYRDLDEVAGATDAIACSK
jgi:hypothetical protein